MAEKKWRQQAEAVYRAMDKGLIKQRTDSYHWSIPASPKARAALALILGGMLAAAAVGAVLMGWFPAGWLVVSQAAYYILLCGGFAVFIAGFVLLCYAVSEKKRLLALAGIFLLIVGLLAAGLTSEGKILGDEMANGFSFAGERLTGEQMDALSDETVEWLNWYSRLSPEEQLAVSYVPADLLELLGYYDGDCGTADAVAEEAP